MLFRSSTFDLRALSSPCTFDRGSCIRPHCVRSHKMRSIVGNCLRIPTVQVLKRWSIGPARATRGMGVYVAVLDRRSCVRSHLQGPKFYLCLISPISATNCTNDLQHTKILKQLKTLDINTAKSLTNIS